MILYRRFIYVVLPAVLTAILATTASAQPDDSGNWNFEPDNDPAFERWQHKKTKEFVWLKKADVEPFRTEPKPTLLLPADLNSASPPVETRLPSAASSSVEHYRPSATSAYIENYRSLTASASVGINQHAGISSDKAAATKPVSPAAQSILPLSTDATAIAISQRVTPAVQRPLPPPPIARVATESQPTTKSSARIKPIKKHRRARSMRRKGSRQPYSSTSTVYTPPPIKYPDSVQPLAIPATAPIVVPAPMVVPVLTERPAVKPGVTAPIVHPVAPDQPQTAKTLVPAAIEPVNVSVDLQPVCAPERPSSGDPRIRRPGRSTPVLRFEPESCDPTRLPPPTRDGIKDFAAVPDRWRIVGDLGYDENLWDPYSGFNILKGDRPVTGEWFFNGLAVWDSIIEPRSFPVPVGNATTQNAGEVDLIGNGDQTVLASNLIAELVYYRGDTIFRPPDWEIRFTPVFNINQVEFEERGLTNADPSVGRFRRDTHIGIQSAFVDYHIRNVSDRYDFDSIRVGIQPYNHDFRGFLFLDQPLGIRLFGTRDNNIFQYNIGAFRRIEKDTNSGLNDISMRLRNDDVFVANVFWQDLFKLGFISQFSVLYNRNREAEQTIFDRNQFIARPSSLGTERARDYDVTYLGYTGDGHFGRLNLSVSTYGAFGRESNGTFNNQKSNIQAYFAAFEAGFDHDWIRYRLSFLYGSGDSDPYDDKSEGFDAVFENPIFAGADTSYWIRQTVPLIGGGRVTLSGRNGVLNSLRSSKEQGQSNFVNPGIILLGLGADLDLSTTTRLSFNANQLWFDESATVEIARNQGSVDDSIGTDLSAALIYRPFATQNVVFRLSGAVLLPGEGFKNLFGDKTHHSVLANLLLVY